MSGISSSQTKTWAPGFCWHPLDWEVSKSCGSRSWNWGEIPLFLYKCGSFSSGERGGGNATFRVGSCHCFWGKKSVKKCHLFGDSCRATQGEECEIPNSTWSWQSYKNKKSVSEISLILGILWGKKKSLSWTIYSHFYSCTSGVVFCNFGAWLFTFHLLIWILQLMSVNLGYFF